MKNMLKISIAIFAIFGSSQFASAVTAPQNVRAFQNSTISVSLLNEFSGIDKSLSKKIASNVLKIVRTEEPFFLAQGLGKIIVRPLIAQENFIELIGLNRKNQIIGSFLIREKIALKNKMINYALAHMFWSPRKQKTAALGAVTLSYSDAVGARAYLNGFPLQSYTTNANTTFKLDIPENATADSNVLMITGRGRPVVGRILDRAHLLKTHRWSLPNFPNQKYARR